MSVKLKDTVLLPKTAFPMKANLAQREPDMLKGWQDKGLSAAMAAARAGAPSFVLHDGPPYANADIHIGHALNKVLKDVVVRARVLAGFHAPYVPGWDCHGLPIEKAVEKQVGRGKRLEDPAGFRRDCRAYAKKYIEKQKAEFIRLGVLGDWENRYATLDFTYEHAIASAFLDFFDTGLVYRGRKPVQWCISCQTALAEAEVEYEDRTDPSVWVAFPAGPSVAAKFPALAGKNVAAVIWTTTPWTLPANFAIAVNAAEDYRFVACGERVLLVAGSLAETTFASLGAQPGPVVQACKGAELEGLAFRHPWMERDSVVVLGEHVTMDSGSGLVHTAPGHGADDFYTGQKYGLPLEGPVDGRGHFTAAAGADLVGQQVFAANPVIVEKLRGLGVLLKDEPYPHSYPHCWRCKEPLIFRATEQWFAAMDQAPRQGGPTLREKTVAAIADIGEAGGWIPPWGQQRIHAMISGRPDWCLSRQRVWGVPILAVHCAQCGKAHVRRAWMDKVLARAAQEGFDFWFEEDVQPLLPADAACGCGGTSFTKETDILDVWFDSGVSHVAVLKARALPWPADLYLEGSDQHRGWFHTSLLTSMALFGQPPYKQVLTHGFVMDGQGRKMSKSLGNVISPLDVVKTDGADILRLWVSMVDYRDDVRISPQILDQARETYRKIRNTVRFLLANLEDFDPARDGVSIQGMGELDCFALLEGKALAQRVTEAYTSCATYRVYQELNEFCAVTLSAFYLDVIKDRLYIGRPDDPARRAAQTVLHRLAGVLIRLMAPVLPFTAEEAWAVLPGSGGGFVAAQRFDLLEDVAEDGALRARFAHLAAVRDVVNRALEEARNAKVIGSGLQASVTLQGSGPAADAFFALAQQDPAFARDLLIVSELILGDTGGELRAAVSPAPGAKCERCWHVETSVSARPDLDVDPATVCDRCHGVLASLGHARP